MLKFRSLLILFVFSLALGMSAQTKKTTTAKKATTTAKSTTNTAKKTTGSATKKTDSTAAKTTTSSTTAKKTTSPTAKKTNSTAAKTTTSSTTKKRTSSTARKPNTTSKTASATNKTTTTETSAEKKAKQDYKEGFNEGFEAGLRASEREKASKKDSAPARETRSSKRSSDKSFMSFDRYSTRKPESKNAMFAELKFVFDVNGGSSSNHLYELDFGYLRKVTDNLRTGFGLGFSGDFKFDRSPLKTIPVFWRNQVFLPTNKDITPFLNLDLGYVFNDLGNSDIEDGMIRINPTLGAYFGQFYVGLGYLGQIMPKSGAQMSNNINLSLGLKMGDRPKSNRKFKNSFFQLDGGVGAVFQSCYKNDCDEKVNPVSASGFVNFTWMFPIGKHFALGPGLGAHFVAKNAYLNSSTDKYAKFHDLYVPLFARGEYTFGNEKSKIRPYAAADFGLVVVSAEMGADNDIYSDNPNYCSPTFEIQGGVKLNNKLRVGIGWMLNPISYNGVRLNERLEDQTLSRLNAHVGWEF